MSGHIVTQQAKMAMSYRDEGTKLGEFAESLPEVEAVQTLILAKLMLDAAAAVFAVETYKLALANQALRNTEAEQ